MPRPYKVEIFDREFTFKDFTPLSDKTFFFDYLTLEKTKVTMPKINAEKGDFVHVTDFSGNVIHQAIVAEVVKGKTTYELSLAPLHSLFDLTVSFDRTDLIAGTLEDFIAGIITDTFISNADTLQNITGLSVESLTSTSSTVLNLESNIDNLYSIIVAALKAYGIVVSMVMDPQEQEISVSIQKASSTATVIEAGIRNVLDKNLVIGDRSGAVNKLTLINQDDETETVTYYLHTDGTVSTTNSSRVSPVFASTEYVNGSDFAANAEKRAVEALTPQQFNNLIELTFRRDDQIIDVATMAIGTMASIIDDGNVYKSILTGYAKSEDLVTLVFGIVRADLTKKLIIERRSKAVATPIPSVDLSGVGNVFGPLEHAAGLVPIWNGTPDSRTLLPGKALSGSDDKIVTGTMPEAGRLLAADAAGDAVDALLAASAAVKHVNRQDHTTNNTVSNQLTQNGFRYIQGDATSDIYADITFPIEFDAKPIVHVTLITGAKLTANGVPADVGDFPETLSTHPVAGPRLITVTGFRVVLWRSAALAANSYYGITWEAKGTKART